MARRNLIFCISFTWWPVVAVPRFAKPWQGSQAGKADPLT